MSSPTPFPATYSLLAANALLAVIIRDYPFVAPTDCTLFRSYANDVYLITGSDSAYILKVYRTDWRTVQEINYEIDLLAHLAQKGIRATAAVRQRDGSVIGTLQALEGPRYYVLYSFAEGDKPAPPFTEELYLRFGQATAQMHEASSDFTSPHRRRPLDLTHFLDQPLEALRPWLANRPTDWQILVKLAEKVRLRITSLAKNLDWGPCHGDLSLDNLHITTAGEVIFYDFDSGGPGWRASDPYGVYRYARQGTETLWPAFLRGYRGVRAFGEADLTAVPYFAAAYSIEQLGHQARNWVRWGGLWLLNDTYIDGQLAALRHWDVEQLVS